jgi:predicted RecB family nuclease
MYVGLYTESEINAQLETLKTAINVVITGGKTYRLNDSQGDIQVTRSSLDELRKQYDFYASILDELSGDSGIISVEVRR